jgi:hypothetical protein
VRGQPSPPAYAVDADWHRRLHHQLGQPWPCDRDLFVHDSGHTERMMLFELQRAWPAIDRGAIAAEDGTALFGIALKDVERPRH